MTEASKIEKSDSEYRVVGPPGCGNLIAGWVPAQVKGGRIL